MNNCTGVGSWLFIPYEFNVVDRLVVVDYQHGLLHISVTLVTYSSLIIGSPLMTGGTLST